MPRIRLAFLTAAMLALGAVGGEAAVLLGLPMPWMLGSLMACGALVLTAPPKAIEGYQFPMTLRSGFVALIGVMIGAQVTPELLGLASQLPWTIGALVAFVILAHGGNHLIFRRIGGYDRATAFYSATPGGLMESIILGEGAGADGRILVAQQFLRIILVISILPLGLSLWLGEPVGSAAGLKQAVDAAGPITLSGVALVVLAAAGGLILCRAIRLPAAQLTGPLLVAGGAGLSGAITLQPPVWLIAVAQVVVGTSLGLRFHGLAPRLLRRSLGLAALTVGYMLALAAGFAAALHAITDIPVLHLLISFAPGGVAEMSVVALSLAANPALVSLHHILRIMLTVAVLGSASRLLALR